MIEQHDLLDDRPVRERPPREVSQDVCLSHTQRGTLSNENTAVDELLETEHANCGGSGITAD